jgi:glutamine amidotransferase
MTVAVVDYGMGNLGSVRRALEAIGASSAIARAPDQLQGASHVILPGVGSFSEGMRHLRNGAWDAALADSVAAGVPLFGICLGMQMLAAHGEEGGREAGLGFIRGTVRGLREMGCGLRLPHVGWNTATQRLPCPLLAGLPDDSDFYFVHGFAIDEPSIDDVVATTTHAVEFPAVVARGNVFGAQFHPEKSSRAGLRMLRNFVGVGRC